MQIDFFMVPKDKVVTVSNTATLKECSKLFVENRISSVVVLGPQQTPVGIVTKTNIINAFYVGMTLDTPVVNVMSPPEYIASNLTMGHCADVMAEKKKHHLLVKNEKGDFVGIVSTQDVVQEAALDAKAWPFIRAGPRKW